MKNILLFILGFLLVSIISCNTVPETKKTSEKIDLEPALIEFAELEHDFGKVTEGERVGWHFSYENKGGSDLVITNVHTTCGCTVPQFNRKPLPPGGQESLQVIFDSSGRMGKEIKNVRIESNALNSTVNLKLYFEVIN